MQFQKSHKTQSGGEREIVSSVSRKNKQQLKIGKTQFSQ